MFLFRVGFPSVSVGLYPSLQVLGASWGLTLNFLFISPAVSLWMSGFEVLSTLVSLCFIEYFLVLFCLVTSPISVSLVAWYPSSFWSWSVSPDSLTDSPEFEFSGSCVGSPYAIVVSSRFETSFSVFSIVGSLYFCFVCVLSSSEGRICSIVSGCSWFLTSVSVLPVSFCFWFPFLSVGNFRLLRMKFLPVLLFFLSGFFLGGFLPTFVSLLF